MARYFTYTRAIENGIVKDLSLHRFNETNSERLEFNGMNVVRIDSTDELITEWLGVQNCDPVEYPNYEVDNYAALRRAEYPSMVDYIDAMVKGDVVAQQAYVDACLAIKAKYPKAT